MDLNAQSEALRALPKLSDLVRQHGLWAQKSLGQNFLFDLNITDKIVRAALPLSGATVIEIGPGPGGLTRPILWHGAAKVIAIEFDPRALPLLAPIQQVVGDRLQILQDDALKLDFPALLATLPKPVHIIANLPYNIATSLLLGWLQHVQDFASITIMMQKEVVDRIAAPVGTKEYGRLAIMAQWLCRVYALFDVPASAFIPAPKVTSRVVQLRPYAEPIAPCSWVQMERTCGVLFGQRRKMLRAILKPHHPDAETLLAGLDIPATHRPEQLTIPQIVALANALSI